MKVYEENSDRDRKVYLRPSFASLSIDTLSCDYGVRKPGGDRKCARSALAMTIALLYEKKRASNAPLHKKKIS